MNNSFQRILLVVSLFMFFRMQPAISQESNNLYTPDSRLYECMDKTYVDRLITERSELIPYYNYFLDNSYNVVSLKLEKPVTGIDIHTVTINSSDPSHPVYFAEKKYVQGKFNPMKYNFKREMNGFATYVWKEAGIAIEFIPMRHFQAQFHEYIKENNSNR